MTRDLIISSRVEFVALKSLPGADSAKVVITPYHKSQFAFG